MTVRDRAGNARTVEAMLPDGLASDPGPASPETRVAGAPVTPISNRVAPADEPEDGFEPAETTAPPPRVERAPVAEPPSREREPDPASNGGGQTLLVAKPQFPLRYEVEDAGPGGPALVELWVTRDGGRTWSRQPEDSDHQSPYNVDLGGEGTFGLWLVVQSASGLGDPPPGPGDRPQQWVEVDNAPPSLSLDRPMIGKGANVGRVAITWRAGDAHPASRPVSLFYRADRTGADWTPIVTNLDNTGKYVWTVPPEVPPKFHVRIDVVDALGNRATADTTDAGAIVLDRARPRGKILGLDPAARTGADGAYRR